MQARRGAHRTARVNDPEGEDSNDDLDHQAEESPDDLPGEAKDEVVRKGDDVLSMGDFAG